MSENAVVPELCDREGTPLQVEAEVQLDPEYDEAEHNVGDRVGKVVTIYQSGDFYGFSRVAFRGAVKGSHQVPNNALTVRKSGHYVTRDGKRVSPFFERENDAHIWVLKHQPHSVDWATRYEGYGFGFAE